VCTALSQVGILCHDPGSARPLVNSI
jgi:hypothetical protein